MHKRALIVANQHYREGFSELPSTRADSRELKRVLTDPAVGGFDVDILENATAIACRTELQRFFEGARADDLLLLHMSCHGRKDRRNRLHFIASDTDSQFVSATAVSAEFISDLMEDSLSRRIVVLLDCCYSGAFSKGMRTRGANLKAEISAPFDGRAQVVITSSTSLQYSYEGGITGSRDQEQPSVFTATVVAGLRDGAADLDQDGYVSTDDLYNFIHRRIKDRVPDQTPTRLVNSIGQQLFLARNPNFSENGLQPASEVDLVHVTEDRPWAHWISGLLTDHGITVHAFDLGSEVQPNTHIQREIDPLRWTVAVLSPAYLRSTAGQTLSKRLAGEGPAGGRWKLIPFRTEGVDLPAPYHHRTAVDALGVSAETCGLSLLISLGYPRRTLRDVAPAVSFPFPGRVPTHMSLPRRNSRFSGRTRTLEALYAHFVDGRPGTATLHGPAGVGKLQIALEYAQRFKWRYDLIWWIDAGQADGVILGLSQLARELGLVSGGGTVEAARAARNALEEGNPTSNWLLVLGQGDDAPDAWQRLGDITGPGHLIVTARSLLCSEPDSGTFRVDVFDHVEATTHLMRGVPELDQEGAESIACELHDHPMALDIAAAHLATSGVSASTFIGQLRADKAAAVAADSPPGDGPALVRAVCSLAVAGLREQIPEAARLLELTVFLAPHPIAVQLLFSREMSQAITPRGELPAEKLTFQRALDAICRRRLMEAHATHLSMHRVIRTAIRDEMSQDQRTSTQRAVHTLLARVYEDDTVAYDPSALQDVWPHLLASGAFESDDYEVRHLLVASIRYLARENPEQGLQLGRALMELWERKAPEETPSPPYLVDDDQILSLQFEVGNALRLQGSHTESMAWNEAILTRRRELLGDYHPYTLLTAQSLAADHRALGRFQEALALTADVHRKFARIFHENHRMSLDAAHDLAVDLRLTGDYGSARKISLETWHQRINVLGLSDPDTLASKSHLARTLRELGEYALSATLLREIVTELGDLIDAREYLRQSKSLAVTLRWAGELEWARTLTVQALARYKDLRLTGDADAVACRANLAADEAAAHRPEAARESSAEALRGFQQLYGPAHPFTLACRSSLGVHLRLLGDLPGAMAEGEQAVEGLSDTLGARHPYTLTALASLANTAAEGGHLARAQEWGHAAHLGVTDRRGTDHPDTYAYTLNLAITLRASGQVEEAMHLRDRALDGLSSTCGKNHPRTAAAQAWQRIDGDLEPA